jgi:hypothetical protein
VPEGVVSIGKRSNTLYSLPSLSIPALRRRSGIGALRMNEPGSDKESDFRVLVEAVAKQNDVMLVDEEWKPCHRDVRSHASLDRHEPRDPR